MEGVRAPGTHMLDHPTFPGSTAATVPDLLLAHEAGTLQYSPARVDVVELLGDLRARHLADGRHGGKDLVARTPADTRPITSDPGLLGWVLDELVANALDASRPGERVVVRHHRDPHATSFAVHNPAVMDQTARVRVFQRLPSSKGHGRGLGTHVAKLLTEHYLSGHLRFGSNHDHGTVFVIDLPHQPWVRR